MRVYEIPGRAHPAETADPGVCSWLRNEWRRLGGLSSTEEPQAARLGGGWGRCSCEPQRGEWEAGNIWALQQYTAELEGGSKVVSLRR